MLYGIKNSCFPSLQEIGTRDLGRVRKERGDAVTLLQYGQIRSFRQRADSSERTDYVI